MQVVEYLLVDIAKVLALGEVVEIHLVDFVDDLPQKLAGLHVVVGVFEDVAHHAAAIPLLSGNGEFLELGEELVIDEGQQSFAGDAFRVGGPGAPAQVGRNGRTIVLIHQFKLLVLIVNDFEEEHPAKLGDALGVAIDAGILAHDVLNRFYGGPDGHVLTCSLL